jgi:hypothetical protein
MAAMTEHSPTTEQQRLIRTALAAAVEVCWKATRYTETEDGDVATYLLPAGCVHRLVGALQGAGVSAALRADGAPDRLVDVVLDELRQLEP